MKAILNHNHPNILEEMRIKEMRKLTFKERYERLLMLLELSYEFNKAKQNNSNQ